MSVILVVFVALFGCTAAFAFIMWARWLGGLYGAPRWLRWIGYAPGLGWITLTALSVRAFVHAARATTDYVDPANKARLLAEAIAEGMYLFSVSWAVFVLFVVPMLVFTWRYRWSQKTPKPEGQPPYR